MPRAGRVFVSVVIVASAALSVWLRSADLDRRPMHTDEAIHADKCLTLLQSGEYVYDPHDYHGPTLYYLTLPVLRAAGVREPADAEAWMFRIVPVGVAAAGVLLLLMMRDALGRAGAVIAALFAATLPALGFYASYYIQETPLVTFTLAAVGAGWRFARSGSTGWMIACGAAAGLMHGTKETSLIVFGAAAAALLLTQAAGLTAQLRSGGGFRALLLGTATAAAVSAALHTNFGRNPRGVIDAGVAVGGYSQRAIRGSVEAHEAEAAPHRHPWSFYIERHFLPRSGDSLAGAQLLVVIFAAVGAWFAFARSGVGAHSIRPAARSSAGSEATDDPHLPRAADVADARFARFLVAFVLLLGVAYTVLPYKTPWSFLGVVHLLTLLAGIGAGVMWEGVRVSRLGTAVLGLILMLSVGRLALISRDAAVAPLRGVAERFVYGQSLDGARRLGAFVERLATVDPRGRALPVYVLGEDPWPLPWYLRAMRATGYWSDETRMDAALPRPAVLIVARNAAHDENRPRGDSGLEATTPPAASAAVAGASIARWIGDDPAGPFYYGQRADAVYDVFVERALYEAFAAASTSVGMTSTP